MTAFTGTPTGSTEYGKQTGIVKPVAALVNAGVRAGSFEYTHSAGAGTGEVNLLVISPGRLLILAELSKINTTQFASSSTLDLGFRAYTEPDGDAVNEDDNAFADNLDTAAAAIDATWALPAAGYLRVDVAQSTGTYDGLGLVIFASVDSGNIEDTDTISGWCLWGDSSA